VVTELAQQKVCQVFETQADRTQAAIYALQKRLVPLNEALDTEK
jgi:hypothetical protein